MRAPLRDEAIQSSFVVSGLLRGACHRAALAPTRWLAMTNKGRPLSAFLADDRVEAVRSAACACEIKTGKAEQNGSRATVIER
jgi:hypothetical protein